MIERDGCNLQRWNPPERSASAACGGDLITHGCQQQTNTIIQKLSLAAQIDMDQLTYFAALHLFESCKSSPNILPTHSYQLPLHWVTICVGEMRIFCSYEPTTQSPSPDYQSPHVEKSLLKLLTPAVFLTHFFYEKDFGN